MFFEYSKTLSIEELAKIFDQNVALDKNLDNNATEVVESPDDFNFKS